MQFSYKAKDANGAVTEGTIESNDRFSAARELRAKGQIPVSLEETKAGGSAFSEWSKNIFAKVKLRDKILFAHNLAGMLSAGLSLYRALEVQSKQNKNPAFSKIFDGLLATINQGGTFSDGLAKYPKVFPPLFVSMVRAGEESGNLSGTLNEIGISLEKSYNLSRKVKGAMMYPAVIIGAMFMIAVLMLIFVVPTLTKVFTDQGVKLPASTQFIVNLSYFASHHTLLFLGMIFAVVGAFVFFFKSKKFERISDKLVLKLPAVGDIAKQIYTARTARTLSSLLQAGVEMTRAIEITRDVLQNSYYKAVMERAGQVVQKGESLSNVFKSETDLYPVMVGEMISVGEETGALTKMLADVATYYEEEVDAKTKNLSTIIEPILMIVIGGGVGFFAISIISPIYSLLSSV